MTSNRSKHNKFVPEALTSAEVATRDAAAEWRCALLSDSEADRAGIRASVSEQYPEADMDLAQAIVKRESPYEDVTDELVSEVLAVTHGENYEILPWREAVLGILAIEFMANLKSSSAQLSEDAVSRVTRKLGDSLRGTTKNACQLISGQRTRLRKTMRTLVLASLYLMHYRKNITAYEIQEQVMQLVQETFKGTWYRQFKLFRNITARQLQSEMMSLEKAEALKKEKEELAKAKAQKAEKDGLAKSEAQKTEKDASEKKYAGDNAIQLEPFQNDVMSLVKNIPNNSAIRFEQSLNDVMVFVSADEFTSDEFPFDGFLAEDGTLNMRGRFAFCEAMKFVRGMMPHLDELDAMIQKSSKRWRIERMALVDLNILRMASYELFIEKKSSPSILINEAVELAKLFGAEKSKNFVNGILQQLCNDNALDVD